ncbi:hypothetical protein DID75_04055, partial [Candidatus Marinamargulisbacteria bacterium SCGC AG-410-N11]
MLNYILQSPLFKFLCISCLIFGLPFIYFPLTDGDIVNWTSAASELNATKNFLTGANDQGHGPLMVWTGAIIIAIFKKSFFWLNSFNYLMSLIGVVVTYFFSKKFWNNSHITTTSIILFITSISVVYLSRTPMYDW